VAEREAPLSAADARALIVVDPLPKHDIDVAFDVTVSTAELEWIVGAEDVVTDGRRSTLAERDFVDATGRRTDAGRWARTMLRPSETPGVRVDHVAAAGGRVLLAGIDGRLALVAGQEGPSEWGLSVVGSSAVPHVITRLVAVGAYPALDEVDRTITPDELAGALQRTRVDEPAADAGLVEALLSVPWARITIRTVDGAVIDFAQVPTWGLFELQQSGSEIALVPVASDEFYVMLIEVVRATL